MIFVILSPLVQIVGMDKSFCRIIINGLKEVPTYRRLGWMRETRKKKPEI